MVSEKLGLGAKPATPKNVRRSAPPFALLLQLRLPPRRKINCTLQNARVEKAAKNLHGGLRGEKRGLHLKYKSCT